MKRNLFRLVPVVLTLFFTGFTAENYSFSSHSSIRVQPALSNNYLEELWEYTNGDPINPNNYSRVNGQQSCIGVGAVCCIVAKEDLFNPGHPLIGVALQSEILTALESSIETNSVTLRFP